MPALSEGWKGSFRELLAKADAEAAPPAWAGLPRAARRGGRGARARRSARSGSCRPTASRAAAAPGQYLTLRLRPDADAPPLVRSYSLSDVPGEEGFRISVKREGAGSRFLHDHVKVGDVLDVAAPRGEFVLATGRARSCCSAPASARRPSSRCCTRSPRSTSARPVWWVHGARNRAEHAFAARGRRAPRGAARRASPRRLQPPRTPDAGYDITGRLDLAVARPRRRPDRRRLLRLRTRRLHGRIGAALTARGVAPERVATEVFGAAAIARLGHRQGRRPRAPRARRPRRHRPGGHVRAQQPRRRVGRDRFANLLDFAEACDVPVGFGCRTGVCHNCESGVLAGDGELPHRPARAAARRAHPASAARCRRPSSRSTCDWVDSRPWRFDVVPRCLRPLHGPVLAPRSRRAFADLAGVGGGQRALDVGCGPGALTAELVARLGPDPVAAVDPSEPFVAAAAASATRASTCASARRRGAAVRRRRVRRRARAARRALHGATRSRACARWRG